MTGESNQDAELDEAFAALVAESDDALVPERDDLIAAPSARSSITSSVSVEEAALRSMLPARGLTQPGWDATSPQPPRAAVAHMLQTPSDGTATAAPSTHGAAIFCPTCKGTVDVRSRHVAVHGGAVRVYCSAECLDKRDELPAQAAPVTLAPPPKRRRALWLAAFVAPAAAAAAYVTFREPPAPDPVPPPPALAVVHTPTEPQPKAVDPEREADARLVEELSRDAWIHPLAGPARRMPRNHTGAFGASRPGDRPPECVSGHCGVDLGYVWGEPVYAVHGGVIEFVNRGPNEDRGGAFVRIEHRDGQLFSWYFHLAAIPRHIRRGVKVKAGDLIGLVGDTGIKHSKPHLHFSLSVKTKHGTERYLDPEPLIALWPLWIPNADHEGGVVSTAPDPGIPVRGAGKRRPKRAKTAKAAKAAKAAKEKETAAVEPADSPAGSDATAPASATSPESLGTTN